MSRHATSLSSRGPPPDIMPDAARCTQIMDLYAGSPLPYMEAVCFFSNCSVSLSLSSGTILHSSAEKSFES